MMNAREHLGDGPPDVPEADGMTGESAVASFENRRRRLFGVAYRMLGTVVDAEDILQDAYVRWARLDRSKRAGIMDATAYLVRLVTRLCIDHRRSAHARRMEYVGPWLPEPLLGTAADGLTVDPRVPQDVTDDLSVAFMVMLERLSAVERAVFLLRESFDFSYREIGPVVEKSEQNCRQIHRRATQRLQQDGRSPGPPDRDGHDRLVRRFLEATRSGEVDSLLSVLADDVVSYADGGGKVAAARMPVEGATRVAAYLAGLIRVAGHRWELRLGTVNGESVVLTYSSGVLHNVVAIQAEGDRVRRIFIIVNPDKIPAAQPKP